MRVAIVGGTGLLGRYLIREKPEDCELLVITGLREHAMEDEEDVKYLGGTPLGTQMMIAALAYAHPDIIIIAAGMNSPEEVERKRGDSTLTNIHAITEIAALAMRVRAKVVYISSNGVYSGDDPPYSEQSPRHPVNLYGHQKAYVEELIGADVTIIRPSLMYGNTHPFTWARKNIVQHVIEKLQAGQPIEVFDDIWCRPLYAAQCARVIWKIIEKGLVPGKSWNLAGLDRVNIYTLAEITASIYDLESKLISRVRSRGIRRPKDTSFDTTKMETIEKPIGIADGLRMMMRENSELKDKQ